MSPDRPRGEFAALPIAGRESGQVGAEAPRRQGAPPPGSMGRYYIQTWGCQMNLHDSEKLGGILAREGYAPAESLEDADVILLNTCSIREKAAEKLFSELGRLKGLKRSNPDLVLGVCGCVAQQEGRGIFARAGHVDFVVGPRAIGSVAETLSRIRAGDPSARRQVDTEYRRDSIEFPFDEIRREGECTAKAYVTVVEGCNHRCTYCIVPTTRGREVCREMNDILSEVRSLAARGILEIEFLGQTVNAYRDHEGHMLGDLLRETAAVHGIRRIRFTTSHPAQMTDRLMDAMADMRDKVCPYLHLPVQSGSSPMLARMRRGYDRDGYLRKIEGLRRRIPGLALGTDIIVGFPSESDQEFEQTMSLLTEVRFDTVYSFIYSPRPGTAALAFGDPIDLGRKKERLARLQQQQKVIQAEQHEVWIGREVEVLVQGPSRLNPSRWTSRTPEYRVVHFRGDSTPGRLERVRVLAATAYSLQGELVSAFA